MDWFFDRLKRAPRLLIEAKLLPLQGERFQPTGFPNQGPAVYHLPDGTRMLLVESAQSMANRLEQVCWDEADGDLVPELAGLPYVRALLPDGQVTTSILEAHRLNSAYLMSSTEDLRKNLVEQFGLLEKGDKERSRDAESDEGDGGGETSDGTFGVLSLRRIAGAIFKLDPGSVLHGVFLEKVGGRIRLQRLISAFIEARGVEYAESGGVKNDRYDPRGDTKKGYGNVPFSRTEFTAQSIKAYVSVDLAQLRAYGLGEPAERLLVGLALFKVLRLLDGGMRLRTACDLRMESLRITAPSEATELPSLEEVESRLPGLIRACAEKGLFASPPVTEVRWNPSAGEKPKGTGRSGRGDKRSGG